MEAQRVNETETGKERLPYVATTNACKLCTPLGAALAYQGIEGAVPFLHGSQGCATYMRRYLISHFREPIDIASSSLGEKHAVYGGGPNLKQGIKNVIKKYRPQMIGIATTCLTETIGDDVPMILHELRKELETEREGLEGVMPVLIAARTPSYAGTHMEGFHTAVRAVVDSLVGESTTTLGRTVNLLPGFLSPADLRYLKEMVRGFGLEEIMLPDFADRLDGPALTEYRKIPAGGTPVAAIRAMGGAHATIEFGRTLFPGGGSNGNGSASPGAAALLEERFKVPRCPLGVPIGLRETDAFTDLLTALSGHPMAEALALERGRLLDAYTDGHKYVFGKRAVLYGEEDLVIGLAAFLAEIGIQPVLCASGGQSGRLQEAVAAVTDGLLAEPPLVREKADFQDIAEDLEKLSPDLMIGNSKGYRLSREMKIPFVRVGFPIHDRFGAQRVLTVGYRGTLSLLDRIINALLEKNQDDSPVGYGYL